MKKEYLVSVVIIVLLSMGYVIFLHTHILMFYDSFMEFSNHNYYKNMRDQWEKKSSNYLLSQLIAINDEPRFSTAAAILTQRNEKRAIGRLRAILNSHAAPHFKRIAIFRLVDFKDEESIKDFLTKAYEYRQKNLDWYNKKDAYSIDEYRNILQALSAAQREDAYPLIMDLARNGKDWEKGCVLSICLFYYKKHSKDIIPIYENDFFSAKSDGYNMDKASAILGLEQLGDADAINALKNIAEKAPEYRHDAERAITFIKTSQKK